MSDGYDKPVMAFIGHEPKLTTLARAMKKPEPPRPALKELEKPKSVILTELESEIPGKITKVRSCSDCCMECNPDGTENTVGRQFQKEHTKTITNVHGTYSWLDCQHCPIHMNMTDAEWEELLAEIDGTE